LTIDNSQLKISMRKFLLSIISIILFAHSAVYAQKITVNARIDSTVLRIGEQAHLTFQVSQQPNQKVSMPLFSDTIISGLEIVEPMKLDTVKSADGHLLVTQHYVITAFDDSLLYIPSYPFVLNGDTVWSKSLSLKVIQPYKIDTATNQVTDIKPVMDPKFDWAGLFLIIFIILAVIALIAIGYVLYTKYFKKQPVLDVKSQELLLPPHVVALNYLDKLKKEKSWQLGRSKEYHTELTDVLRAYIERMYSLNSMEMTSEEILDQFKLMRLEEKSVYMTLQQILKLADLVKFAKWDATPDEHELSLMNAYLFINLTKVEDIKPLEEIKEESKEKK
jgi:hypothetical protein